jgi:uncharacterized protein YecE (DUF72 family)
MHVRIGTAGWSIPRAVAQSFPGEGSHLARYARVLPAAEINSSFHRPHREATYRKWAEATPPSFRFAVKVPRTITHEGELRRARAPLERFLAETAGLGDKRGPLLVQLPPKYAFDARVASRFFELLRTRVEEDIVCEPRHATWFTPRADALLTAWRVARVCADPPTVVNGDRPGGWTGLLYFRLHGSPRKYWSPYDVHFLTAIASQIREFQGQNAWCIFDNTASGAAAQDALRLASHLL